jgi:hypothetical protein
MPKVKISEYSATANSNTDVASINIDEGCAPSGINNAIRAVMGHLKDFQQGTNGDPFNGPHNGTVGATTPAAGAFTTLSATGVTTVQAGTAALPAITTTGDTNTGIFFPAADTIAFAEGGAESMRLDSAGNLGLGVTPSAWGSAWKAYQYIGGSMASPNGSNNLILQNAYNDGTNYRYVGTAAASNYQQSSGSHIWNNAASGTAGNAITFTQAMTLDASGNLIINDTSRIGSARLSMAVNASTENLFAFKTTTNGEISALRGLNSAGSEVVAINYDTTNSALLIRTGSTERARIFSGGGISVFSATTANDTIDSCNNQAAGTTYSTFIGRHSATAIATGTVSCRIYTNGNIINTNNSYGQISDIKLKENIVDATPKLEKLNQVRVVNFNFIGDQQKQLGVVAQELEQVFPGMIDESPDKDAEGNDLGTVTKSVKYSVFVPMLIKALQEQQAIITTLTARISALESA